MNKFTHKVGGGKCETEEESEKLGNKKYRNREGNVCVAA